MTRTSRRAWCVRASARDDAGPLRYRFLGYTEDHLAEGTFVLLCEDDVWTAARFRQEIGCPDVLYQEGCYEKVARCLSLAFAFTVDAVDVGGYSVCLILEGVLSMYVRFQMTRSCGSMVLLGQADGLP